MAKLPRTPDSDQLRKLAPDIVELSTNTDLVRVYFRGGPHPSTWRDFRYFGPTNARFDHHVHEAKGRGQVQERGVMYLATSARTCVAEVFQDPGLVIARDVREPWLVVTKLARPVRLLNLFERFALRAGASMKLISGARTTARNWARGFYEHYPTIEGIYFPSSMTNEPVVVFNERADTPDLFQRSPVFHRAFADPVMTLPLIEIADEIGYRLL